ncbi:MAG: UvrD-helicase domain-containing protein [Patescibacteria group bacterium]
MSTTLSHKNKIVIASAGSGKTTFIVNEALKLPDKKILITTYTNENLEQIRGFFIKKIGHVPKNVTILSWYTFLFQDGVHPYQNIIIEQRINGIIFSNLPNYVKYSRKEHAKTYFVSENNDIFRDRVSEFVVHVDDMSSGLVIHRLQKNYDFVFVDELQDLSGYDLNIMEKLFNSNIFITAVGDPRQSTFSTNNSSKNRKFKRGGIFYWAKELEKKKLISLEEKCECHRCNQKICDFADALFPNMPKTTSTNIEITGHDGIFNIAGKDVLSYVEKFKPAILKYRIDSDSMGLRAINIGVSKGLTYDRVLIFPTKPMLTYLSTNDISKAGDIPKLYVAVTRAKYSVVFVID